MIKDAEKILSITHKTRRTGREGAQLSQRTVEPQLLVPRGMQRNYRIRRHRPLFNCQNFECLAGLDQVSLKLVLYL